MKIKKFCKVFLTIFIIAMFLVIVFIISVRSKFTDDFDQITRDFSQLEFDSYKEPYFRSEHKEKVIATHFGWNSFDSGFMEQSFLISKKILRKTYNKFGFYEKKINEMFVNNYDVSISIDKFFKNAYSQKGIIYNSVENVIEVDYKQLWKWNIKPIKTISDEFKQIIKTKKLNYKESVNLIISFLQDMEYFSPPSEENGKTTIGIWVPLKSLSLGKGDCDTKAIIFACIIKNIYNTPIICIIGNEHLFTGILGVPKKHDYYITYKGEMYILCDVTGPARMELGIIDDINRVIINGNKYKTVVLK